jgi:probable addiction module antidote protein
MTVKATEWNIDDELQTPQARIGYLEAVMRDDARYSPALLPAAIGDVLRVVGVSEVARKTGLNREALYRAFSDGGNPTYTTLCKVLGALGVRVELVADGEAPREVVAA